MTHIEKRKDGFWLVGLPMDTPDMGPYEKLHGTQSDMCAKQALRDMEKFFCFDYWEIMGKPSVKVKVKKLT
jgi:hypothetical protein